MLLFPHQMVPSALSELDQFGCTAGQSLRQNAAGTTEECFTGSLGNLPQNIIKKNADTVVTNRGFPSLVADPDLTLTVDPDTRVRMWMMAWYSTTGDAGMEYTLGASGGAPDYAFASAGSSEPSTDTQTAATTDVGYRRSNIVAECADTGPMSVPGTSTRYHGYIYCDWYVNNGASTQTWTFDWAQNTADDDATIVHKGSFIEYRVLCTSC
jgi:hypothetical protein